MSISNLLQVHICVLLNGRLKARLYEYIVPAHIDTRHSNYNNLLMIKKISIIIVKTKDRNPVIRGRRPFQFSCSRVKCTLLSTCNMFPKVSVGMLLTLEHWFYYIVQKRCTLSVGRHLFLDIKQQYKGTVYKSHNTDRVTRAQHKIQIKNLTKSTKENM